MVVVMVRVLFYLIFFFAGGLFDSALERANITLGKVYKYVPNAHL